MSQTRSSIGFRALGSLTLLAVIAAGCGDDDTADGGAAGLTAFCDAYFTAEGEVISLLFTGEGDADQVIADLDAANALAPDDIAETMDALVTGGKEQLRSEEQEASDKTLSAYSDSLSFARDNCDVESLDITAVNYSYEGVPDVLSTGTYVASFTNKGTEQHEMFVARFLDGTTETLEELVELPDDEVFTKITPVNAQDGQPGDTRYVSLHLDEPGRYFVVCFIPIGSVDGAEGTGPPHFAEGMYNEFIVE